MWFDREIKRLIQGEFETDCQEIRLIQHIAASPATVVGPGNIRRQSNGRLVCKIFAGSISKDVLRLVSGAKIPAGAFYPRDHYFRLEATTVERKKWWCDDTIPALPGLYEQPMAVEIEIPFLDTQVDFGGEKNRAETVFTPSVAVYFREDMALPTNESYEKTTTYRDEVVNQQWDGLVHVVEDEFELRVERFGTGSRASLSTGSSRIPKYAETRLCEALNFLHGVVMRPVASSQFEGNIEKLRIYGFEQTRSHAEPKPPLGPMMYAHAVQDDLYSLLFAYLKYVLADDREPYHFLSRQAYGVHSSSDSTPDANALATCVAVEAILNSCFADIEAVSEEQRRGVQAMIQFIEGFTHDETIKSRLLSLLPQWYKRSAAAKLNLLAQRGLVDSELPSSWKSLRNKWAHPGSDFPWEISEITDQIDAVRTLFHQLVFCLVGYRGKFTDYSKRGWPFRDYPVSGESCSRLG